MPRAYLPVLLLGIVTITAVCLGLRWKALVDAQPLPEVEVVSLASAEQEAAPVQTTPAPATLIATQTLPPASIPEQSKPQALTGPSAETAKPSKLTLKKVNINSATAAELDTLPGIGPVLAERIVTYRQGHGLFKTVDNLQHVEGIGPKKLADLKPWAYVEPAR